MKRINPNTNLPFKKGDIRNDGYAFYQYQNILNPDGYYKESWIKPEIFNYHNFTKRSGNTRLISTFASQMLGHARSRCKGIPSRIAVGRMPTNGVISITKEWIIEKLLIGICEATGDILSMEPKNSNTASLDRIDPLNYNYTPENSRIVTWQFNNMKGAYSDEEFIRVAEALKKMKNK